jgi:hypothetical protein
MTAAADEKVCVMATLVKQVADTLLSCVCAGAVPGDVGGLPAEVLGLSLRHGSLRLRLLPRRRVLAADELRLPAGHAPNDGGGAQAGVVVGHRPALVQLLRAPDPSALLPAGLRGPEQVPGPAAPTVPGADHGAAGHHVGRGLLQGSVRPRARAAATTDRLCVRGRSPSSAGWCWPVPCSRSC